MKSRPFVITFALLSLIGAGAMESSVTKRLRFAYWERPATEITLGIPEGKKGQPIRPYTMCFQQETRYSGPSSFPLLRQLPPPKDAKPEDLKNAKERWEPCGNVKLDGITSSECDILLIPGPNNTWSGHPFDASESQFPWGGVRVINLGAETLEGVFNGKPVKIAGKQQVILPHVFRKDEAEAGTLALYSVTPQGRKLVLSNAGMFDNHSRVTVFLIKNTTATPARYESRSIQEPKPAAPDTSGGKPAKKH